MGNLNPSKTEEQMKRLWGIIGATLKERRIKKVCLKCGTKGHNQ
jgi:hypothetical protein